MVEKIKNFIIQYKNWLIFSVIAITLIIVLLLGVSLGIEKQRNRDLKYNEKASKKVIQLLYDSLKITEKRRLFELDSFTTLLTSARNENSKGDDIHKQIVKEKQLLEKEHGFANSLSKDSNLIIFSRDGEEYISSDNR